MEAAGGIVLMFAAVLALLVVNLGGGDLYHHVLHWPVGVTVGPVGLEKSLLHWINDGLMAIFFLLVGLEIKREVLDGELSDPRGAVLPVVAAVGGMAVPALFYIGVVQAMGAPADSGVDTGTLMRGWAIPAATDIAFALGILALAGSRAPVAMKVFLTALAIIDDLGAIIIIALFYTADLSTLALAVAGGAVVVLALLNLVGITRLTPYLLVGLVLWVAVLKSGVHATLAGVVLALAIPLRGQDRHGVSPLRELEHDLHAWVAFAILPVFAFANAGVKVTDMPLSALVHPVTLGVAAGLFLGKQVGVMLFSAGAIRTGIARMPEGTSWGALYGTAMLTGVGFTMSLFIGTLAFDLPALEDAVRLGVLGGSLLSGVLGYVMVVAAGPRKPTPDAAEAPAAAET